MFSKRPEEKLHGLQTGDPIQSKYPRTREDIFMQSDCTMTRWTTGACCSSALEAYALQVPSAPANLTCPPSHWSCPPAEDTHVGRRLQAAAERRSTFAAGRILCQPARTEKGTCKATYPASTLLLKAVIRPANFFLHSVS